MDGSGQNDLAQLKQAVAHLLSATEVFRPASSQTPAQSAGDFTTSFK